MKKAWLSGVVLAVALAVGSANATVTVVGGGYARDCYLAAVADNADSVSLRTCDLALSDQPLSQTDRAATLVNRGIIYLNRSNLDNAMRDFDRAIEIRPVLAEAHTNRAAALLYAQDYRGAIEAANRSLSLSPEEPHKAYFIRAAANEELGLTSAAYHDYRRASELAPEWGAARAEMARFRVN
jgi:tetratricopeptide (TPR) repeat protein